MTGAFKNSFKSKSVIQIGRTLKIFYKSSELLWGYPVNQTLQKLSKHPNRSLRTQHLI